MLRHAHFHRQFPCFTSDAAQVAFGLTSHILPQCAVATTSLRPYRLSALTVCVGGEVGRGVCGTTKLHCTPTTSQSRAWQLFGTALKAAIKQSASSERPKEAVLNAAQSSRIAPRHALCLYVATADGSTGPLDRGQH